MLIEKKVKLKNNIYYVVVDVEYKKSKSGFMTLRFKNGDSYDGGDFTRLIVRCQKAYTIKKAREYDEDISLMADVLYLYDRIPFLVGIKDVYTKEEEALPSSLGYITKDEIENYINEYKVKMNNNPRFNLNNEETWII
jgi:hypothetical protein